MRLMFVFFLLSALQSISQTSTESVFQQLLKYEQALMDGVATGDKALWSKHLHDSCIITLESGEAISKQKMIEELNPLPKGYAGRIVIIEPKCKIYGNTAVITFINDEYLELFNQKIHTQYRQSDTWLKENGQWRMISMQLFEIPKNPPPVKIAESILKQYAGIYELSNERKCEVYVENGKLYARKSNREAVELLAETENVFFRDGDGRVTILFIKSDDGSYKMVERREGEDVVWKKIK